MCLIFPKDPRCITCFENPCYQNMNSNAALAFDGFDIQIQNTSIERHGQPIYWGAVECYYYVDSNGKYPPAPVLYTIHDIFWLFCSNDGGPCGYDTTYPFDEVIEQITSI
ncbi:MAG: hypothetical protein EZS28_043895 [Streblomastix strix]|uniref:Uncharacterized protein n=1 Tax=Streblomastix strix TaxID=222440 RepID=A0A5J4TQN9_9EUKA|nr:MAG: hypothetical protein EZS28_043895 [Streblomastix strix]